MALRVVPNPDKNQYEAITQRVVDNDGYCPCMLEKTPDTKCICKAFRNQNVQGYCHCGRFVKVVS